MVLLGLLLVEAAASVLLCLDVEVYYLVERFENVVELRTEDRRC